MSLASPAQNSGRLATRIERLDQLGVEPCARALADLAQGEFGIAGRIEDIGNLRHQRYLGVDGNLPALQAERIAFPVPVFVEAENARCHPFGKTHLARDVRTPVATCLDDFPNVFLAVLKLIQDSAKAFRHRRVGPGVAHHEAEHLPEAAVHQLEVALEATIVGQIELTDA